MTDAARSNLTGKPVAPKYASTADILHRQVLDEAIRQRESAEEKLDAATAEIAQLRQQVRNLEDMLSAASSANAMVEAHKTHLHENLTAERSARQLAEGRVTTLLTGSMSAQADPPKLVPYRIEIPLASGGKRTVRLIPEDA